MRSGGPEERRSTRRQAQAWVLTELSTMQHKGGMLIRYTVNLVQNQAGRGLATWAPVRLHYGPRRGCYSGLCSTKLTSPRVPTPTSLLSLSPTSQAHRPVPGAVPAPASTPSETPNVFCSRPHSSASACARPLRRSPLAVHIRRLPVTVVGMGRASSVPRVIIGSRRPEDKE